LFYKISTKKASLLSKIHKIAVSSSILDAKSFQMS